jgi:predicted ATPase/DNA-binding winged helix-turn-helix (wHTH) protein
VTEAMNARNAFDRGYCFGPYSLFPDMSVLCRGDKPIHLSPTAMKILIILVERRGEVVTKDTLVQEVWSGSSVDEANLAVHVGSLRRTLGPALIKTCYGRGYQFTSAVSPTYRRAEPSLVPIEGPPAFLQKTNLPKLLTKLIGRDDDVSTIGAMLDRHRLVSLVGAGGIGKTRLALEIGWQMLPRFADGVRRIDLGPVTNPEMVASATATAIGIALRGSSPAVECLATNLLHQQLLLIYDNCEYVADATAEIVSVLLERVPRLTVLATTQQILRVRGEQIYRLPPLDVPPISADDIGEFAAVELFIERGREADHHFELLPANAGAVAEICRCLDGIPLALEMAAALIPFFGVMRIRDGLDERLEMLATATVTADLRHQTMRNIVEWSYGLVDPSEQPVFRRLGIFPGSFSLEAAIDVAGTEGTELWKTRHVFRRLIEKSLIAVEHVRPPRYRLLETIRLYAVEKLATSGEYSMIAERHAFYFNTYFERAYDLWEMIPDDHWLATNLLELDNARASMNWALADVRRAKLAISLVGAASRLWYLLALFAEGRDYVDRAATLIDLETPLGAAARLLRQACSLWHSSDRPRALALQERAVGLYRQLQDRLNLGSTLGTLGALYAFAGRHGEARTALLEAQAMLAGSDSTKSQCLVMDCSGILATHKNELAEARRSYARALDLARRMKDVRRENTILINLGDCEFGLGEIDRAVTRAREAVSGLRAAGDRAFLGVALINLATYLLARDSVVEAQQAALEGLATVRDEGGLPVRVCLQLCALIAALIGRYDEAALLVGFVDSGYAARGESRERTEQKVYDRLMGALHEKMTSVDIQAHVADAMQWSEDHAVEFAQNIFGDSHFPESSQDIRRHDSRML